MKAKKYIITLIVGLIVILLSSCSRHSCLGTWNGRGSGTQVVFLHVAKDGTFSLRILPKSPDTYIQLYRGRETDYEGEWRTRSDDDIMLICKRKTERYSNFSEEGSESTDVFYLRKDGAFCTESPHYTSPTYDLIRQAEN